MVTTSPIPVTRNISFWDLFVARVVLATGPLKTLPSSGLGPISEAASFDGSSHVEGHSLNRVVLEVFA